MNYNYCNVTLIYPLYDLYSGSSPVSNKTFNAI